MKQVLENAIVYYNIPEFRSIPYKPDNNYRPSDINNGEILSDFDPEKEKLYEDFDNYFNHPMMTKIKDVGIYSVYMCKTYCLLSNECRYIIVFVHNDAMPTGTQERLLTLKWISLQTRTLSDQHNIKSHSYQPKKQGPLNVPINRVQITSEASMYICENRPIKITLLHGKNGAIEYQDRGNIIAALETYQTIITI